MNYQKDIKIDKFRLDDHWEEQSDLTIKYCDLSVDANKIKEQDEQKVEVLEEDLKTLLAELVLEVKSNFAKYGFDKSPSDSTASSWAITQQSYKDKQKELRKIKEQLIESRDRSFRLRNAAKEFENRRHNLEYLTKLFFYGYYSENGRDSKIDKEGKFDDMHKKLNESMRNRNERK